jgi:CBS domain containing-hemolysin-like protein
VTIEDLLEEIVGEIDDEHDDSAEIIAVRPGVWRVEARISVERINEELDIDLPESDEYESLAGLVLSRLKRIPETGESLVVGNLTVRVTRSNERSIEELQLLRARKR